jgi:KaiC/GvpD/RAD55 family RecA-like ATPase
MSGTGRVSTGVPALDDALRGGLPERRATLLVGGPGTGKSTLAVEFLQRGLDAGESCLYVSTEQTPAEFRDSYDPFTYDLDHPDLDLTTLHAAPRDGRDGEELVMRTLEGGADIDDKEVPFTGENVVRYLERTGGPSYDRIVLDSVSGLESAAPSIGRFRRTVTDLIRLFDGAFGGTSLFVTETDGHDALRYNAHGVLRVWRDTVGGDHQRFVRVDKMRGVDHDTRAHLFEIGTGGVRLVKCARDTTVGTRVETTLSTGVAGLDELLGGGLVGGDATVLEHDGLADRVRIVNAALTSAFDAGWAVALVPPMDLHPEQLARLFEVRIAPLGEALADDRFFVIDPGGVMDGTARNVFFVNEKISEYPSVGGAARHLLSGLRPGSADWRVKEFLRVLRTIDERRGDRPLLLVTNTQTLNTVLDGAQLRQLRHREHVGVTDHEDAALFVHNPTLLPVGADGPTAEFYADNAAQVLRTWLRDGVQYVTLRKGPSGHLDGTRYVEPVPEPPFVRVQRSVRTRSDTASSDDGCDDPPAEATDD